MGFFDNIFKNKEQITQEATDLESSGLDDLKSGDFVGVQGKLKKIYSQVTGEDDDSSDTDDSSDDSDDSSDYSDDEDS